MLYRLMFSVVYVLWLWLFLVIIYTRIDGFVETDCSEAGTDEDAGDRSTRNRNNPIYWTDRPEQTV